MRSHLPRWLCCAALGLTLALLARGAEAQTAVLFSPPDSSEIRELRVAVSTSGRTAVWFSVTMYGGSDDVFMIVPAPEGAAVDTSTDAWFEALVAATNTRVLPPSAPPACATKPAAGAYDTVGQDAHTPTQAPVGAPETMSFSELVVWAQAHGLMLTTSQLARLAELDVDGSRFLGLRFSPPAGESLSRTLRVTPASLHTATPLVLSPAGGTKLSTTVWHFAPGRVWPKTLPVVPVDNAKLRWTADGATAHSNYSAAWYEALAGVQGEGWIVDAASHSLLFQSLPLASGAGSIPSVGATYFERAGAYGDATGEWSTCATRFASLQQSASKVATACGRGELAWVGADAGAACKEQPQPGELNPDELRCGPGTDDLAIALSGSSPSEIWLTRWSGYVPAWTMRSAESIEVKAGPEVSPVVRCAGYEKDCESDAGTGGGGGSPPHGSGGSGTGGSASGGSYPPGGGDGYGGANGGPPDPTDDEEDCEDCGGGIGVDPGVVVETSCSGDTSSSSSGDSCSGDSSSSSSGDSCDGDSSQSGGDSCDGDSSQSGGDSCDGDSSQSGGESCDGDTTSSGGGESCDGGGTSGGGESCSGGGSTGGSDCSIAKSRGRKPPLSGMTMLLASMLLPLRRWRRH